MLFIRKKKPDSYVKIQIILLSPWKNDTINMTKGYLTILSDLQREGFKQFVQAQTLDNVTVIKPYAKRTSFFLSCHVMLICVLHYKI